MTPGGRHHLDHASTSPLRPEARAALSAWLDGTGFGDPSRIHQEGLEARHVVEAAREQVAGLFRCRGRSVVFTSGASEAIAAAYVARFHQDAALRTADEVDVRFVEP